MQRVTFQTELIVLLGFMFVLRLATAGPLLDTDEIKKTIADRIDKFKTSKGIVVGIIDAKGRQIIAHGTRDGDPKNPVDGKTIFEIGSITKVFTALLLADMVERGILRLHDPIQNLVPKEVSVPKNKGKEITLFHLTSHTSGFPRLPDNIRADEIDNPYSDFDEAKLFAYLGQASLTHDLGTYDYSNLGVGLLGTLLSHKAKHSFEELMIERITAPLKMIDTGISWQEGDKQRVAQGHDRACEPVGFWDFKALAGAGAIRSTAEDMLTFLAAHMDLQPNPLTAAMKAMRKNWLSTGVKDLEIGMGWHLWKSHGTRIVWHNGGTHGFYSFAGFDEDAKRGVIVLSNSFREIDDIGLHILNTSYPLQSPKAPKIIVKVAAKDLEAYVGEYELAPQAIFTITTKDGKLFANLTGQPTLEIFPEGKNRFFYKVVDAQIIFESDSFGKVTRLVLDQYGVKQRAEKRSKPGVGLTAGLEIKLAPEKLERFVGSYLLQPGIRFTVTMSEGILSVQLTGQQAAPIFPRSETRFFYKIVNAEIEFTVSPEGKVEGLTLFQHGRELFAKYSKF